MADDPNPALRAELIAAMAVLNPQIRGLHDLETVSISAELKATVTGQVADRERRRDLIQAVLTCLDQTLAALRLLEQDGYPALPAAPIMGSLFSELQEENSDLAAAIAVFATEQIAAGPLTQTANPAPPTAPGP